jgi:hypothetical protein
MMLISYFVNILAFTELLSKVVLLQGYNTFSRILIFVNSVLLIILNGYIYFALKNRANPVLKAIISIEILLLFVLGFSVIIYFDLFPAMIIILQYPILFKYYLIHSKRKNGAGGSAPWKICGINCKSRKIAE